MKKSCVVLVLFLAFILVSGESWGAILPRVDESVVKIVTVTSPPDYHLPWQKAGRDMMGGSGVVIQKGRILTNAHVVANQTFVQVQRQGDPEKYQATVLVVGHECDLALLEVTDPKFVNSVRPVSFGKMPSMRDKVAVYGYPIGGDKLSITEGVVSRIEMGEYAHCWRKLPYIQIDAAINPGNSGGPVIDKNKIVGIAFQGMGQAENVGYMIPPPVIEHFLEDVKDGKYDGFPSLGIANQNLENPQHRESLGMKPGQTGVLITRVAYNTSAWGVLREGDVILSVEGQEVANNGTVPFANGERIDMGYFLVGKHPGDLASLNILREGKEMKIEVPLITSDPIISTCDYDKLPSYYIFGGLVFTRLNLKYMESFGGNWWMMTPPSFIHHLFNDFATPDRQDIVVLSMVLADEVNVGYHDIDELIVISVDGQNIESLEDMVRKIETAKGEFVRIECEGGNVIVLNAARAREANPIILERYGIPSDRSEELR